MFEWKRLFKSSVLCLFISVEIQLYGHDFVCGDMCVCVPRTHHIVGHETDLHEVKIKISGLLKKYKIIGIFCYGLQYVRGTCIFITSNIKEARVSDPENLSHPYSYIERPMFAQ
jgi:hypothetical protein